MRNSRSFFTTFGLVVTALITTVIAAPGDRAEEQNGNLSLAVTQKGELDRYEQLCSHSAHSVFYDYCNQFYILLALNSTAVNHMNNASFEMALSAEPSQVGIRRDKEGNKIDDGRNTRASFTLDELTPERIAKHLMPVSQDLMAGFTAAGAKPICAQAVPITLRDVEFFFATDARMTSAACDVLTATLQATFREALKEGSEKNGLYYLFIMLVVIPAGVGLYFLEKKTQVISRCFSNPCTKSSAAHAPQAFSTNPAGHAVVNVPEDEGSSPSAGNTGNQPF